MTSLALAAAPDDEKKLVVDPPQSLDLIERRLELSRDVASSDEQRFSIALKVERDSDIFSSSKVISAFWNERKQKILIK